MSLHEIPLKPETQNLVLGVIYKTCKEFDGKVDDECGVSCSVRQSLELHRNCTCIAILMVAI